MIERQHILAVGILEVVGQGEALGPVCPVSVADLQHPSPVGLVAAVHQRDAARERRAAVRPAANFQTQSCAATFQCAEADSACHEICPVLAKCRDRVCEALGRRMTRYGDIARVINGLRTSQGSIELHATLYFPCAMALRLMPRSPWRRIRLASITAGLMAQSVRSDRIRHRQLGTSHGCRDHTVLPYASTSYVLRDVNRSRVCPALRPLFAPTPRVHRIPPRPT